MTYKDTLFLPQTDFGMKANLAQREPELLARWERINLYQKQRIVRQGKEQFTIIDGPPYANGPIHIGHALNKTLKDVVNRIQFMSGKNTPMVPVWDCHGLPIEWKVEEKYKNQGKNKDEVDIITFRKECRDFASHWINVQMQDMKRLGVMADWENPLTTMDFATEAKIAQELLTFAMNGSLYRGWKPVMWSVVEKTALAEAEVEYKDHTSTTVYVRFSIRVSDLPVLNRPETSLVIWTTTPWSLAGNRAIAYGPDIEYVVVKIGAISTDHRLKDVFPIVGENIVIASDRLEDFIKDIGIQSYTIIDMFNGKKLAHTICFHPWANDGYDFPVPLLPGSHVTADTGTGLVHIAPSHGIEDFELGLSHGLPVPDTIDDAGYYRSNVPLLAGEFALKATKNIFLYLKGSNKLLASDQIVHSYPHSWRSHAPLIYRATPQWFISMEKNDLRTKALNAIDKVQWFPAQGHRRIRAMVESRPDWCISRQRSWGVPIPIFVHKETEDILKDPQVCQRIIDIFAQEGSDAWFSRPAKDFLGPDYVANDYEQIMNIVDVWFESGTVHTFEHSQSLRWPASLYLEGSDQHRGWFQSSLLESCGTRGTAPFEHVLTHGFVLDEQGRKMSKSLGNTVAPQDIISKMGADILRLWVITSDYFDDVRIGQNVMKNQEEMYRRFRNTLRYLLGALHGFNREYDAIPWEKLPPLEQWVLHRLVMMNESLDKARNTYDFKDFYIQLHAFCSVDLSAFYFDIRKDSLYCDKKDDAKRLAALTVMDHVFECLARWLAPVLCFTAEEAFLTHHQAWDGDDSVHLQEFITMPNTWHNPSVGERWHSIRDLRSHVTAALEKERASQKIGSSLGAHVSIHLPHSIAHVLEGLDIAEICITSSAEIHIHNNDNIIVNVTEAKGDKCPRCWKITVNDHPDHLCTRCNHAIKGAA